MTPFTIRPFNPADIPAITALQQAYQQHYPHAAVVPGEAYLSAGFEGGRNIFCAFDPQGRLQGYAPLFPVLAEEPHTPHTLWTEVKVDPSLVSPLPVRDLLFDKVVARSREIVPAAPGRAAHLTFQYHPSETAAIAYACSRGCQYTESVFRMVCSLDGELVSTPPPHGIEVRRWRMHSVEEQQAYVQARNAAFPEAPIHLADWQSFLSSPAWQTGTTITAFDGQEVAGSVTVYWDDSISAMAEKKAGFTEYIFVGAGWRRRGIAAYMIYQAMLYLQEHSRRAAVLEVKAANQQALDLYRLGYQVIDESQLHILNL